MNERQEPFITHVFFFAQAIILKEKLWNKTNLKKERGEHEEI